jgi:hypothetical protein
MSKELKTSEGEENPGDTPGEPTRDRARSIYEANIQRSTVHGSEAIWSRVRAAYGHALEWEMPLTLI